MSNNNKCDGYCKLRPGLGYIRLDSTLFGNRGVDFYSGIAYRMDLGYDAPICGSLEFVFVKNGHKVVCLSIKEFKEHFIIIKSSLN